LERAGERAAQADLLLGGEDGVDLERGVLEALQRLHGDPAARPVVERLAGDDLAEVVELLPQRDHVADADLGLDVVGAEAEVDEEVRELRDLRALLLRADVDGLAGRVHHADQLLTRQRGVHRDLAGEEVARVEAAELLQAEEALVVDELHEEADLVHVGGQHRARRAVLLGALHGVQVAHRVRLQLVDDALQLGLDDLADALLTAGYARGLGEPLQEFHARESTPGASPRWRRPGRQGTPPARRARSRAAGRARRRAPPRPAARTAPPAPRRPRLRRRPAGARRRRRGAPRGSPAARPGRAATARRPSPRR